MPGVLKKITHLYRQAYSGLPGRAWILFAVNLVNSSGSMVLFFLSLYLTRNLGFSPARAGAALSFYGFGSLAGAYGGGWLADRIGSIRVQKLSLVLCGALLISLGVAAAVWAVYPLIYFYALAAGALYPANATTMSRVCPPDLQVKGFALNRLANNLGVTVGPAVGGLLALRDYRLLFWADGLTSLLAAGVLAFLWKRGEADGTEQRAADRTRPSGLLPLAGRPVPASHAGLSRLERCFHPGPGDFPALHQECLWPGREPDRPTPGR